MDSPNWNGFFPHGMYGGFAFWVNLSILSFPFYDLFKVQSVLDKDYVAIAVVVIAIGILLTGYIIEEICFFCMKVFAIPVKWHYNYTVEAIKNINGGTVERISAPDKIKTPDDAEIRFDEDIDVGWRNRFTIALINTQIAFGLYLSWCVLSIALSKNKYDWKMFCFIGGLSLLFFLLTPALSHLMNVLIIAHKCDGKSMESLKEKWNSKRRGRSWMLMYNGLILSVIALVVFTAINLMVDIERFSGAGLILFDTAKFSFKSSYFVLIGILETIVTFILIYEANSINRMYGRYLFNRGDLKRIINEEKK